MFQKYYGVILSFINVQLYIYTYIQVNRSEAYNRILARYACKLINYNDIVKI